MLITTPRAPLQRRLNALKANPLYKQNSKPHCSRHVQNEKGFPLTETEIDMCGNRNAICFVPLANYSVAEFHSMKTIISILQYVLFDLLRNQNLLLKIYIFIYAKYFFVISVDTKIIPRLFHIFQAVWQVLDRRIHHSRAFGGCAGEIIPGPRCGTPD